MFFDGEGLEEEVESMVDMLEETIDEEERLMEAEEEDGESHLQDSGESISALSDSLFESIIEKASGAPLNPSDKQTEPCDCDVCESLRTVDDDWAQWDVAGDPVKQFLKDHINVLMSQGMCEINV